MKLAIFGGTGRTGQHLVRQALDAGHQVNMLARDPAKVNVQNSSLVITQGDVTDAACVEQTIAGTDAVLSVLSPTENVPDYKVSRGTQHILAAMKKHHIRRLIISAGAGVGDPLDAPTVVNKLINMLLKLLSRHVYEDMLRTVDTVRASEVDWTVVRVPMLTDEPGTGKMTVAYVGKGMGMKLSREDMARFILNLVEDSTYLRQSPAISN